MSEDCPKKSREPAVFDYVDDSPLLGASRLLPSSTFDWKGEDGRLLGTGTIRPITSKFVRPGIMTAEIPLRTEKPPDDDDLTVTIWKPRKGSGAKEPRSAQERAPVQAGRFKYLEECDE